MPYLTHPADSQYFDRGFWLKHPIKNSLFPLSSERKAALIKSFIARPDIANPAHYEDRLLS